MSVYKVISNYYNDLLNYLYLEDSKAKGLTNWLQKITSDQKKVVMTKISDTMVRFDMAFAGEINYWKTRAREQGWFIALYIILLIIMFVIMVYSFLKQFKEIKNEGGSVFMVTRSFLTYLIAFMVLMSIFVVLLVNVRSIRRLSNGQIRMLQEDQRLYSNHLFTGASRDNLSKLFAFIGYWQRNSRIRAEALRRELRNNAGFTQILALFPDLNAKTASANSLNSPPEIAAYDLLKGDMEGSLVKFYSNGDGYQNIRKMLVMSSPILMLKEARRIMGYYYMLGDKNRLGGDGTNTEDKDKQVVKDVVITPINDLLDNISQSMTQMDKSSITRAVADNAPNTGFNAAMDSLTSTLTYLALFCYPITLGKNKSDLTKIANGEDKSATVELKAVVAAMPQNINLGAVSEDKVSYYKGVKNTFALVYDVHYDEYVSQAKNLADSRGDPQTVLDQVCLAFIPLVTFWYTEAINNIDGGIWFPFNREYMIDRMNKAMDLNKLSRNMPRDFRESISITIYDSVITYVGNNFDPLEVQRDNLIQTITTDLLPYRFNLMKHQNYVITEVMKQNAMGKKYVDEITQMLSQIQKTLVLKRQTMATDVPNTTNGTKFKEFDEFASLLDDVQYTDFVGGLEVDFYTELVQGFYATISESVQLNTPNLRNLYYERRKAMRLWKIVVVMLIIIIILILVRFLMGLIEDKGKIKSVPVERDCDKLYSERDYSNRNANWWIRACLSISIVLFLICILVSFYKKIAAANEFNIEMIESNTNQLKSMLEDFQDKMKKIDDLLEDGDRLKKIGAIDKISPDDKMKLYDFVKRIIDKYEKCNFIIESAKTQIPFPYTEVSLYGVVLIACIVSVFVVFFSFSPIKRLMDIKQLNKLKQELLFTKDLASFSSQLQSLAVCHNEEMDGMVLTLKFIFFGFLIMFLIYYSITIISSANDFKMGLYNSNLFDEGRCYEG